MSNLANLRIKHLTHTPDGRKLTPSEKGVLMQIADDHNEDRGYAWPSIPQLAARVGLKEKQCRRIIKKLEQDKVIQSRPRLRDDNNGRLANDYRFWFDKPFDAATTAKTEKRLRLQAVQAAARPKQMVLTENIAPPPPLEGREGLPPMTGGPGHGEEGGTPAEGRGGLPPKGGQATPEQPLFNGERENARATVDTPTLAGLIVLAHPYAVQREWTEPDIPMADRVAAVEAIRAEAERAGVNREEASLGILRNVERIAREVPREQWRFLKPIEKFLRLREYRMEPADLYRQGEPNARTQQDQRSGPATSGRSLSPAVERGINSRQRIDAAGERRKLRHAAAAHATHPGAVPQPGAGAGNSRHVPGGVGGDGLPLRPH